MALHPPQYYRNPVIPGFHPDPTICRVGEDYYLAVSSFTYFPGVPLFHSRDLVNWRPLGHVLTRPSQLPPAAQAHSEGIYAPTLRHDGKRFYLITTNVGNGGNFMVTADQIDGPWSDPVFLQDAPGIDPSLFFDDDGRAWVTGTAEVPEGARYFGNNEIWLREFDLGSFEWKGERIGIWRGALRDAVWPEGPHLYKKNALYYLLISEGGTGPHHSVTVARSPKIEGPYEGNPANPILTHRQLGSGCSVTNPGHPDLVELPCGEWWMVLLASRPHHGGGSNRGRETFLAPVVWEDGWPVVSPGSGRLEDRYPRPALPWTSWPGEDRSGGFESFDASVIDPAWSFLRSPDRMVHSLEARSGWLRLYGQEEGPGTRKTQAWMGRRIAHENWVLRTRIDFEPLLPEARAGLCLIQSDDFHLRWEIGIGDAGVEVRAITRIDGIETVAARSTGIPRFLEISAQGHTLVLRWGKDDRDWKEVGEPVDGSFLTTEVAGGFVGCMAGPFAVADHADFDWVDYRGNDD
jgi:alpha-N-arabinofuranosidase